MTLDALEFMRRSLLHVLPRGFVKIRHYRLSGQSRKKARTSVMCHLLLFHPL